jgi:hypothetical protein
MSNFYRANTVRNEGVAQEKVCRACRGTGEDRNIPDVLSAVSAERAERKGLSQAEAEAEAAVEKPAAPLQEELDQ